MKGCWIYIYIYITPLQHSLHPTKQNFLHCFLAEKPYDLNGHKESCKSSCYFSPGGRRSCLLYLICSCLGFHTCVLDNQLRHCHSKESPYLKQKMWSPQKVCQAAQPTDVFPWLSFSFPVLCVYLSAFLWRPCGCAALHISVGEMKGSPAGGARTGGDPREYRQPPCFCSRASHVGWSNVAPTCVICIVCIFKCALFRSRQPEKGNEFWQTIGKHRHLKTDYFPLLGCTVPLHAPAKAEDFNVKAKWWMWHHHCLWPTYFFFDTSVISRPFTLQKWTPTFFLTQHLILWGIFCADWIPSCSQHCYKIKFHP